MVVRRLKVLPIESIVRGYISGSAWSSYRNDGTVCGIKLPGGLRESEKLETPLWTPSTKASAGERDENISPEEGMYPQPNHLTQENRVGKKEQVRAHNSQRQIS